MAQQGKHSRNVGAVHIGDGKPGEDQPRQQHRNNPLGQIPHNGQHSRNFPLGAQNVGHACVSAAQCTDILGAPELCDDNG